MPDSKITALTSISTSTDPANDPLVIVDVSDTSMAATGTTKKVTLNQLLGASGTATLASATITGDLTVDTNVFKVDTTNNVVGIGTATPQQNLHVVGTGTTTMAVERSGATIAGRFEFASGNSTNVVRCVTAKDLVFEQGLGTEVHRIAANGVATWQNVGGVAATAMTLNATGLGVGVASPATKLDVRGATNANQATFSGTAGRGLLISTRSDSLADDRTVVLSAQYATGSLGQLVIQTAGTDRLLVDNAGNVGIGVTPSATWASNRRALQIGGLASGAVALNGTGGSGEIFFNSFFNTSSQNICVVTGGTGKYDFNVSTVGAHSWSVGTGTAGNAFTFTQAMTLDASGNLIVNGATQFAKISSYVTSSGTFQSALGATNGANSDFVVRIKTSVSDVYNSVGSITLSTGGSGGTERVRVKDSGQVRFVPLAADPAGAEAGDVYYNSVSNRLKYYNGTAWTLI